MSPHLGILVVMRLPLSHRQIVCSLVVVLLFIARTADAHLHLCPDPKLACSGIHFADGGIHRCKTGGTACELTDKDVRVAADGLLKKAGFTDLGSAPPPSWPLDFAAFASATSPVRHATVVLVPARTYFRPPLRGPPI